MTCREGRVARTQLVSGGGAASPADGSFDCDAGQHEEHQRERDEAPPADCGVGAFVVGDAARREGEGCEREDGHSCAMKTISEHLSLLVRRTFVLNESDGTLGSVRRLRPAGRTSLRRAGELRFGRATDARGAVQRYRRCMPNRIRTAWRGAWIRRAADAALVAALAAGSLLEIAFEQPHGGGWYGPPAATVPLALLTTVPLLWRSTRPLVAYAGVLVGVAGLVALSTPHQGPFEPFAALVLGAYSVGAHTHGRRARAGVALSLGPLVASEIVNLVVGFQHQTDVLPALGWIGAAWLVGRVVHSRAQRNVELEALARELDVQRELQSQAAIVDERARIARELHDVVAHNVSMIVVQAGAAARVLEGAQPHVREALAAIELTGRETVDEMRRLLGVLRRADDGLALAPQPTLRELDALAAHVREAGLPVELRVEGAPQPLPPGVDVSAFRIVQEALTNALKHAGQPARARVTVRYEPGAVEVEIEDNGTGGTGGGTGHGLIGMRERVALYGGRLDAGRTDGGGYTVKARLPLGGAPA